MIRNNKGSVSILGIYLCYLMLFLTILTKTTIIENAYFHKENNRNYQLFLIENAIITNIYNDHKNINYSSKRLKYNASMKKEDNDYVYEIKVVVDNDLYLYQVKYDYICNQILQFNNITTSNSI